MAVIISDNLYVRFLKKHFPRTEHLSVHTKIYILNTTQYEILDITFIYIVKMYGNEMTVNIVHDRYSTCTFHQLHSPSKIKLHKVLVLWLVGKIASPG